MKQSNLIALGFLVFGGFFIYSLFKNLWALLGNNQKNQKFDAKTLFGVFKMTLVSLLLLILFIVFLVPKGQ